MVEGVRSACGQSYKGARKETIMNQTDLLTAIATAAEQLQNGAKPKTIAADLERLVMELQKGE